MTTRKLSSEFVSLVHHVELNNAGWWDNTIQRLLIATIWSSPGSLSLQELYQQLQDGFKIQISIPKIEDYIKEMQSKNMVIKLHSDHYKVTEEYSKVIQNDIQQYIRLEENVKKTLMDLVSQYTPSLDAAEMWTLMNDELFLPLIAEMGARTYDLLSQSVTEVDKALSFSDFLSRFPVELHTGLRSIVVLFLSSNNTDTRSYVLGQLNAYFSKSASGLDLNTVEMITKPSKRAVRLTIFIDTNFLFSILGLHDNPSNEAAESLLNLINTISGTLDIKLYVSETTIDETRSVLVNQIEDVRSICIHKRMCDLVVDSSVSSILRKFARAYIDSGYTLDADTFFSPYIDDLGTIIKSHGIYIHRDPMDDLRSDRNVLDDLNEQLKFEEKRYQQKAKKYVSILHDMMLWHFVKKRRSSVVESPLDAKYWIATVDYRFIRFDAYKRRINSVKIPITVDPTTLIQMLQFWVPRSEDLEKALLESLRLPFLFQEFDIEAEKITIKILHTLSRYENVDDLPKESLVSIVLNQGLRSKILQMDNEPEEDILIREVLIEENKRVADELNESLSRESKMAENIAKSTEEIALLHAQLVSYSQEREARKVLWKRVSFSLIYLILPALILLVSAWWIFIQKFNIRPLNIYDIICIYLLIITIYIALVCSIGMRRDQIKTWRLFVKFDKFKRYLITFIIAGILVNLLTKLPENTSIFIKDGAHKATDKVQKDGAPSGGYQGGGDYGRP